MHRFSVSLILLSVITFNTQASSILPQDNSTGADGLFNLLSDSSLFANPGNIYNFTDFTIAAGATLYITANNKPVYIYSQQNITIKGALITDTPYLHLIASQQIDLTGSLISNSLVITTSEKDSTTQETTGSIILTNGSATGTTSTGIAGSIIITNIASSIDISAGTITLTSVPLPAALWLMISGLLSFGLMSRRDH